MRAPIGASGITSRIRTRFEQRTGSIRGLIHQIHLQPNHAALSLCDKKSAMVSDAAAARAPAVRT
jgi:hypothetical protein